MEASKKENCNPMPSVCAACFAKNAFINCNTVPAASCEIKRQAWSEKPVLVRGKIKLNVVY